MYSQSQGGGKCSNILKHRKTEEYNNIVLNRPDLVLKLGCVWVKWLEFLTTHWHQIVASRVWLLSLYLDPIRSPKWWLHSFPLFKLVCHKLVKYTNFYLLTDL